MAKRIELAASKGCDGVDPDNMDAYGNDNGLGLTEQDTIDYITFLANTAHSKGVACGLKNSNNVVPQVADVADFSVVEQCQEYDECHKYSPFINKNKPVFSIEYTDTPKAIEQGKSIETICSVAKSFNFSAVVKTLELVSGGTVCPK